MNRTFKRTAFI